MSRSTRDLLVAVSLANLCFLSPWLVLTNPNHYVSYFWKYDPGYTEHLSLVTAILCFALVLWVTAYLIRKLNKKWLLSLSRLILLTILVWPLNSFLIDYAKFSTSAFFKSSRLLLIAAGVLSIIAVGLVWQFQRQLVRVATTILIILVPLLPINLGVTAYLRIKHMAMATSEANVITPKRPLQTTGPRLVWIVFDELQYNLVFENRPGELKLPAFDRLRDESIFLSNAYSPTGSTLTSLPALTTGKIFSKGIPATVNDLGLRTEQGDVVRWASLPNIFGDAHSSNFSTGLVGWYHPYCRVLGRDLDRCSWTAPISQTNPTLGPLSFREGITRNIAVAIGRVPLFYRLIRNRADAKQLADARSELNAIRSDADSLLRARLNLSFIHFPVPHSPWIADDAVSPFQRNSTQGYLANVILADRTLGEVRTTLESLGEWDNSIVIVSADHWWRDAPVAKGPRDHRIPLIIKLAGQNTGVEYKTPTNTVLTRELIMLLLRDDLSGTSEVLEWIGRNSHQGESSVTASLP